LEIGVSLTAEDSAAGKTMLVNRAFSIYVIRTAAGRHSLLLFAGQICIEIEDFRLRNKEAVVESVKIAAFSAHLAFSSQVSGIGYLQIQPVVNLSNSFEQFGVVGHLATNFLPF
jgi:hypothetical protein